jgi:hypothetical protein
LIAADKDGVDITVYINLLFMSNFLPFQTFYDYIREKDCRKRIRIIQKDICFYAFIYSGLYSSILFQQLMRFNWLVGSWKVGNSIPHSTRERWILKIHKS